MSGAEDFEELADAFAPTDAEIGAVKETVIEFVAFDVVVGPDV